MDGATLDSLPPLRAEDTDWPRVGSTTYSVRQTFRYDYPGPIWDLRQRLMLVPPRRHGDQRVLGWGIEVSLPARRRECEDRFGNVVVDLALDKVEQTVTFEAWSMIERGPNTGRPGWPAHGALTRPTPLTATDGVLDEAAAELAAGAAGVARAERICDWVHRHMAYRHDVTSIHTPAGAALALGAGVCQDYAHIALALCRRTGLAARYVSGHLLGEGGSHAWIEVMVADPERPSGGDTVALDPTHNRRAGFTYLTIATGRDYRDVAPTSGRYRGPVSGVLSAHKQAALVEVVYRED